MLENRLKIISVLRITLFFLIIHALSTIAYAEILVHDIVGVPKQEILLKAETKGKFSVKGGELVEFFVDGKTIGKSLSGGDGFAFKQFIPRNQGLLKIVVKSSTEESSGLLLILNKKSKIVVVDFEEGILDKKKLLQQRVKDGSQDAIREINKKYPVVVLQTGILNTKIIKESLKQFGYIDLPVIVWRGGDFFEELAQKGIIIKAVIGNKAVIDSASKFKPLSFSFTNNKESEYVEDWKEISRRLLKK